MTKVSIVVNCFNGQEYLERCLSSATNQDYADFEIIFWDNASQDNSVKIAEKFSSKKIKIFKSQKNVPLSKARELALRECSGTWVGFLDVDDAWDTRKLSLQMMALEGIDDLASKNTAILSCLSRIISSEDEILARNIGRPPPTIFLTGVLRFTNPFIFQTLLFRTDIIKRFWPKEIFYYCPDYYLILSILLKHKLVHINEELVSYRIHTNNLSKKLTKERAEEPLKALTTSYSHLPSNSSFFTYARLRLFAYNFKVASKPIENLKKNTILIQLLLGLVVWVCFGGGRIRVKRLKSVLIGWVAPRD